MDIKPLLSSIELELQKQVSRLDQPRTQHFHEMLTYHMGWTGEGAGPEATGKRIRPLLVLLTTAASSAGFDTFRENPAGLLNPPLSANDLLILQPRKNHDALFINKIWIA